MSSRRLLLVSGASGSGASTVARALAQAARARGERTEIIATTSLTPPPALAELLGPWDPLLAESLTALPVARTAQALLAAVEVFDDGSADTVVWDAGPIDPLLADLAALDALSVAAGRVSGSLVAMAASVAGDRLAMARRLQQALEQALDRLRGAGAATVLVDEPTPGLRSRVRSARSGAALLGLPIEVLAINRVPRRRDDWPGRWAKDRRRRASGVGALGMASLEIRWLLDDADADDVVRRIATRLPDVPGRAEPATDVVQADLAVGEGDGGFTLHIPMPHVDPTTLRAGRLGDVLILEIAGLRRILALPAVLTRCTIQGGGIVGDDLVLRFAPDPAQWRAAS